MLPFVGDAPVSSGPSPFSLVWPPASAGELLLRLGEVHERLKRSEVGRKDVFVLNTRAQQRRGALLGYSRWRCGPIYGENWEKRSLGWSYTLFIPVGEVGARAEDSACGRGGLPSTVLAPRPSCSLKPIVSFSCTRYWSGCVAAAVPVALCRSELRGCT